MMGRLKYLLVLFVLFWSCLLFGQTSSTNKACKVQLDTLSNREIYFEVDSMPEFPGGRDSLMKFIVDNLRYPSIEIDCEGTIFISFVVEIDGSLTNKSFKRKICEPLDKEAMRVVDLMPRWKAGQCNGKLVPVRYVMPIKFVLN
jgi:protein TonB